MWIVDHGTALQLSGVPSFEKDLPLRSSSAVVGRIVYAVPTYRRFPAWIVPLDLTRESGE